MCIRIIKIKWSVGGFANIKHIKYRYVPTYPQTASVEQNNEYRYVIKIAIFIGRRVEATADKKKIAGVKAIHQKKQKTLHLKKLE